MFSLILSLALAGATAQPAPTARADSTEAPTAKPKKPKKICRATRMTGSSIGKRVCKTEAEWNGGGDNGDQSLDLMDQGFKGNTAGANPLGGGGR